MSIIEIFVIALCLSMDCFAVAVSFGVNRNLQWKDILITAFFFGLLQALMPLVGWMIGNSIQSVINLVDHWIAFSILAIIGIRMIIQSFRISENKKKIDIRNWGILIGLSFATSIDALISGVSFGFIQVNIFKVITIIGIVTFLITIIGAKVGEKSTFIPARRAELIGGIVLIGIGVKILLTHLSII